MAARALRPRFHPYFALAFSDANHGIALGQGGVVLTTADGGVAWRHAGGIAGTASVFAAAYSDEAPQKVLWAAEAAGTILEQEPGGNWRSYRSFGGYDLTDLAFDGGLGVAVGMNGTILLRQSGNSWVPVVVE